MGEGPTPSGTQSKGHPGHISTALHSHLVNYILCGQAREVLMDTHKKLRPVNTSAYIYNNVSSLHTFPCLSNSTIHTALAVLLQTRLQATTSISCCTPTNCAQSRYGVSVLDTEGQLIILGPTRLERLCKVVLPH